MQLRERGNKAFITIPLTSKFMRGFTKRMPAKQLVYTILDLVIHHGHSIDSHRNPDQFAKSAFRTDGRRTFTGGAGRD